MLTHVEQKVLHYLSQFVTEHKKEGIEKVLNSRTRYLTIVLEDIFQSQNASAVIRTCECLGIQDVHIIENHSRYSVNRKVLKGADKWMTLHRYRDVNTDQTPVCFQNLRRAGYKIVATEPNEKNLSIHDLDLSKPVAIVLGNELKGLSSFALRNCDELITIPMFGFTASFNISVSAAVCIHALIDKLRQSVTPIDLSEEEKDELRYNWYKKIVRRSQILENEFLRTIP